MSRPSLPWPALIAITTLGLVLRLTAARGGLWLDEAWSARFAHEVATPLGVFLGIHHDNNHHLNTLWLQLVGPAAPPILQRALSIVAGTIAIPVAALIVRDRGLVASCVAAILFAISPILLTYGSEARGYAPMLLAFLVALYLAQRWLDTDARGANPTIALTATCLLGLLAQLTMVFGVAAILGWVGIRRWIAGGPAAAIRDTAKLMTLPVAVTGLVVAAIVRILPGTGGFRIGNYTPFAWHDLIAGQADMLMFATGVPVADTVVAIVVLVGLAALVLVPSLSTRRPLYLLALIGLPLGCAVVALGNVAIARYFLVGAVALLLLVAEALAAGLRGHGWRRAAAIVGTAVVVIGCGWRDARLLDDPRGDPARAIAALAERAPSGTTVSLDRARAAPVLQLAALRRRYRLTIADCGTFLFVDRDGAEPFPADPRRCGHRYSPLAAGHPTGLSGTHWTLYMRTP